MKDELFDDLLKRKLDLEDQSVTSSEIDQVHKFVRQKLSATTQQSWFGKNGFKIFAVATCMFLAGGMLYQYRVNSELKKNSISLENNLRQNARELKLIEENQKQLSQINQILLTQNQQLQTELIKSIRTEASRNGTSTSMKLPVNVPQKQRNKLNSEGRFAKLQNKLSNVFVENAKSNSQKSDFQLSADEGSVGVKNDPSQSILTSAVTSDNSMAIKKAESPVDQKMTDSLKLIQNEQLVIRKQLAQNKRDSLIKVDSLLDLAESLKWIKKVNYFAGLTTNFGLNDRGVGLMGQVTLNQRFQIHAGLTMNNLGGNEFEDEDDFKLARNREFSEEYTSKYSLTVSECRDIRFQYSILQLPISVSYLLPLKRNYGLICGIGSQLNLRATETVRFQSLLKPSNTPMGHELNQVSQSVPLFTNVGINLGIQKTWNRISLQTLMYVNQSFQKTEIVPILTNVGFKFNLLYRFEK